MNMNQRTVAAFAALQANLAAGFGVPSVAETFAVTPSVEQTLMDKIVEPSDFLKRINVVGVRDKSGDRLMGGVSGTIAGRTNTSAADRVPRDVSDLTDFQYICEKTEYDIAIPYLLLDNWSKFPDFQTRLLKWVAHQKAMDHIMIGWNGTSVAASTDRVANPLLQDVNKGWLQHMRENKAGNILVDGGTVGSIKLGDAGDFKTLDALVGDIKTAIPLHLRDGLISIVGEDLLAWDEGKLYSSLGGTPTEKAGIQQATKTYGGLPAFTVPHFPALGATVTTWENLSIYWQEESNRRSLKDKPERDRTEDFHSVNEAYVVENFDKFAAVEAANVTIL
ncbi:phage major capsid protein, P2 family [uncultured Amphritea sp.]|uniref:phage major capsid protein, P2 family n=1 Tax=uncultured Amphritea sp. TaxID=981605 RepID=UPI0025E6F849|nr:phage major capsid protein, P2 family [uncultured Amphritea sp.]